MAQLGVAVQVIAIAGIVLATFQQRLPAEGPVVADATHAPFRPMTAAAQIGLGGAPNRVVLAADPAQWADGHVQAPSLALTSGNDANRVEVGPR